MTHRTSIAVSGDIGSGKSTISAQLASRLGMRRVSVGDLYRDMAQARGMSALQLNLHAERDETVDDRVDHLQAEMARSHERLVIDSRLGWFFFTEAFKVHLMTDPVVAARRVLSRPASEVEAYSSIAGAVAGLRDRSDSERMRFLSKYGVDKARLRNYDMVCDTTRARPAEVASNIVAAVEGTLGAEITEILEHSPPLLLLDPRSIYPSQDAEGILSRREPDHAPDGQRSGPGTPEPLSVACASRYFYVVDGHRRLSSALLSGHALVAARLVAQDEEPVTAGLSAQQYFAAKVSLDKIRGWEAAHETELPLPPHLRDSAGLGR